MILLLNFYCPIDHDNEPDPAIANPPIQWSNETNVWGSCLPLSKGENCWQKSQASDETVPNDQMQQLLIKLWQVQLL